MANYKWRRYSLNVESRNYREVKYDDVNFRDYGNWLENTNGSNVYRNKRADTDRGIYTLSDKVSLKYKTSEEIIAYVPYDLGTASGNKIAALRGLWRDLNGTQEYYFGYLYSLRLDEGTPTYGRGYYIDEVISSSRNSYPDGGKQGGYWYEYVGIANQDPTISGSDLDLGAKFKDFEIEYFIQDPDGDVVKVEIKVDGVIKQAPTNTTLGVRKHYAISIKDYSIGSHTVEIIATDSQGAKATRSYTFQRVNSAPVISGTDTSLGAKNSAFTYTYQVHDSENDSITITEKLNGSIIRTLSNATLDTDLKITITDDKIKSLKLDTTNTIEIIASDGNTTSFRRVTFTRQNMAPIIADKDVNLGNVTNSLTYNWSATDPDNDKLAATILLDDKVYKKRYIISDGANQTLKIDGINMLKINRGTHRIKIIVEDDKGFRSTRTVTFTRVVNRLVMQLAKGGIVTDQLATRINVAEAGIYVAKGAGIKYEVCNNSFDSKPTWEDATSMAQAGKAYTFKNEIKTAEKAGINIRVTIDKNSATGLSYINAIGGAFD